MSDSITDSIRQKYLRQEYPSREQHLQVQTDSIEQENLFKRKAIRLEIELEEIRKENEQLKSTVNSLKHSQNFQGSRNSTQENEQRNLFERERNEFLRDISDLVKGNKLLSQENDFLTQKYSMLLDVHNKALLQIPADQQGLYSANTQPLQQTVNKAAQPQRWSESARLEEEFECNKRSIQEIFAQLRSHLDPLKREQAFNLDSKEQWREYSQELQMGIEKILRITNSQNDVHDSIVQLSAQPKKKKLNSKKSSKSESKPSKLENPSRQVTSPSRQFNQSVTPTHSTSHHNILSNGQRNSVTQSQSSLNRRTPGIPNQRRPKP